MPDHDPRASLAVSQASVERGRSVELRWSTAEAVFAAIDNGLGAVALSGSARVTPAETTTWTLTATGAVGTTPAVAMATVAVIERATVERSLLPPNAAPLERAMELALAGRGIEMPIRRLWSAAAGEKGCPVALLPYLAWALGVEDWDSDWPEPIKRAAVARAAAIHREKGTLAGLKRLLETSGADYEYVERPAGVPMTARLGIRNSNAVYLPAIAPAIERVKRASLHIQLELTAAVMGDIPIAGGLGAAAVAEAEWSGYD